MARFLFTCWPFHGHVRPLVAIANALRDLGHESAFVTGESAREVVTDQQHQFFPLSSELVSTVMTNVLSDKAGKQRWHQVSKLLDALQKTFLNTIPQQLIDLEPILADWKPDVIACDMLFWGPILILSAQWTVAVCSPFAVCPVPGDDIPPFGLGLPRPRTHSERLVNKGACTMASVVRQRFQKRVNELRRSYLLPTTQMSIHEFSASLPLYLIPSSREFDYGRTDVPLSVHYVGPYVEYPASQLITSGSWLSQIPRDRPWIHVTEGTLYNGEPLVLRAAAEGLASTATEVIITTGQDRDPNALGLSQVGANIHVSRWVSYAELLPRVDLLITTGGAGSVLGALSSGIPMIVIPTGWDKPENAQRVVAAGAGVLLTPKHCTSGNLKSAVDRVMSDPAFQRNAQRLGETFRDLGGAPRGADLLQELIPAQTCRRQ